MLLKNQSMMKEMSIVISAIEGQFTAMSHDISSSSFTIDNWQTRNTTIEGSSTSIAISEVEDWQEQSNFEWVNNGLESKQATS